MNKPELTVGGERRIYANPAGFRITCLLFFFSGFPALIYQLTWQRSLFRLFGVNTESVTIVVTAFMLGLGIGSIIGGWISRYCRVSALLLLGVIELSTAAFGIASLAIFDAVGRLVIDWPLILLAPVNLLLVLFPTLLMGATLPILISHVVRMSGQAGSTVGALYYANTMGAGVACLLCGMLLFPTAGMQAAVRVAAGINLIVGIGALVAWRTSSRHLTEHASAAPNLGRRPVLSMARVMFLAGLGGFISLSYEIFLLRTAAYASGSSALAFAVILGVFLMGIAGGALQAGGACARLSPRDAMRRAVVGLTLANVVSALFLPLLTHLSFAPAALIGLTLATTYLVARQWGGLLPYLAEFGIAVDESVGTRAAWLYLSNIFGSAAGAALTGFVLTNLVGLQGLSLFLLCAATLCVLVLVGSLDAPGSEKMVRGGVAVAVAAVAVLAVPGLSDRLLENLLFKQKSDHAFVDVLENRDGIIAVDTDGTVYGNGMYDGRFSIDLGHDRNGIVRPFALSLFHPAPADVLMIGLSSGSWAQVLASNPAVASLTIVEINPGYRELIARRPEVQSILQNPKIRIIRDDGRRWLSRNPEARFDAIVSNTTWNYRMNVTNLLSTEFLELARRHLKPGGIVFYNTTESARVQRTGCLSFSFGARFTNHMVLSDSPIDWDFDRWRSVLENYVIDGKPGFDAANGPGRRILDQVFGSFGPGSPQIEHCDALRARTAGLTPVNDDNMGTEWRHPLGLE